jgi:predicted Zn-ribbon and HTH transcriptional regulator
MSMKAGCSCPQCKGKGMMQYTGRDVNRSGGTHYQRILKCNNCGWETTEDQVRSK